MGVSTLLAYHPTVTADDLREAQQLVHEFEIQTDVTPLEAPLAWERNYSAIIVLMRKLCSLNLFWWEPHCLARLNLAMDDECLYERLADGCLDFLTWPSERAELALRLRRLTRSSAGGLQQPPLPIPTTLLKSLGLVGRSRVLHSALSLVAKLAAYDIPMLLEGETGTGKELCARALHYLGSRRSHAFVPVNCGALPDSLIENELFGHVSGAYTGAGKALGGLITQAEGGTLFLDEVHCLSPKGQASILRFAQDREYRPLGAGAQRRANVRIVAATNKVLQKCVQDGSFRQDLLYRLAVARIRLPPLRERPEDIGLLVDNIISRLRERYDHPERRFDSASLAWISAQEWPGNVRELENFVHREFLLADGEVIHVDPGNCDMHFQDSDEPQRSSAPFRLGKAKAVADFESRYVRSMLSLSDWNVTEAARRAGKDRRVFGRLMKKYGIGRVA